GSWNQNGTAENCQKLSYFAPGKVMVVCHSQAVHNEIDAFLKNLKTTVARENRRTFANVSRPSANKSGIQPAQFLASDVLKTAETVPAPKEAYPVPTQTRQPKHLFHFIIRYEGDGIIDANVADYL